VIPVYGLKIRLEEGGNAKLRRFLANDPQQQPMEIHRIDALLGKSGMLRAILVTPTEERDQTFHIWGFNMHVFRYAVENLAR